MIGLFHPCLSQPLCCDSHSRYNQYIYQQWPKWVNRGRQHIFQGVAVATGEYQQKQRAIVIHYVSFSPFIVWSCEGGNEVMNGGCVSISRQPRCRSHTCLRVSHLSLHRCCKRLICVAGLPAESSTGLCYSNSTQQTLSINNLLLIDFQCRRTNVADPPRGPQDASAAHFCGRSGDSSSPYVVMESCEFTAVV